MAVVDGVSLPELPAQALTLDNGLRVRIIPLPHLRTTTLSFFTRSGSRYESEETNGLSHFLEHMLYRGSQEHPDAHELNLAIESLGGTLDAATHVDFTSYDLSLPVESSEAGLSLFAELLQRPLLRDLRVEKEILREEILEDLNEDGEEIDVDNVSRQLLFREHPLGYSILGPIENIERFGREDLRRHHQAHYTAANSVLCVAGAFDVERISDALRRDFAEMPRGKVVCASPPDTAQVSSRFRYVHDPGSQTDVRVSFHTPGVCAEDASALLLLARILDDGLSTRVHQLICEQRGLAYDAFAGPDLFEECGVLDFGSSVDHRKVLPLLDATFELLAGLKEQEPSKAEIDKAKRRYLWDLRTVLDDTEGATQFVGPNALFGLAEDLQGSGRLITKVSTDELRKVVQSYLRPEQAYITCVGSLSDTQLARIEALTR